MRVFSNDSGCSLNFKSASVKSVTPTNIFWPENLNKCCNDFDIDNKFLETSSSKSASGDSESPESPDSFKVFDEFLMSHQEVVLDPKTALVLENLDCCCDIEIDTEFLEPIFSDMPSVSHNFTTKMKDFCVVVVV